MSSSICPPVWAPSSISRIPRSLVSLPISSAGMRRPVAYRMWLMKTMRVLGVNADSILVTIISLESWTSRSTTFTATP